MELLTQYFRALFQSLVSFFALVYNLLKAFIKPAFLIAKHGFVNFLPTRFITALMQPLLNRPRGPFVQVLIRLWIFLYKVDLTDAAITDLKDYHAFFDFFCRPLKIDSRQWAPGKEWLASPADGILTQFGRIYGKDRILQAKGMWFEINELLSTSEAPWPAREHLENIKWDWYAVVYLHPRDYHRIHQPLSGGQLIGYWESAGVYRPVTKFFTENVRNLFPQNQRRSFLFSGGGQHWAVVMVGALVVKEMMARWDRGYADLLQPELPGGTEIKTDLPQGGEIGRFHSGSTVVIAGTGTCSWGENIENNVPVKVGEKLAKVS